MSDPPPPTSPTLRVGLLAPPWAAVPPKQYGGTELVLDALARGLQNLGHEVLLFTVGESECPVPRASVFETVDPDRMGASILELRHVAAAYDNFTACDIVHDHTLIGVFLSHMHRSPVVTTNHGRFDDDLIDIYRRTADIPVIAISHDQVSRAPDDLSIAAVIHHGIDVDRYRFDPHGGDHLVALGRMNPTKGIDVAIEVARRAGVDLVIAAKMREPNEKRYFEEVIEPLLGSGVSYVGEADHQTKVELLAGARALINPLQWDEPFGLVMPESLACGTPVIATPRGAAPEIVVDGTTGYLCRSVDDLVRAVAGADALDRAACRRSVETRFSMERMAREHVAVYRSVIAQGEREGVQSLARGTSSRGTSVRRRRRTISARPAARS